MERKACQLEEGLLRSLNPGHLFPEILPLVCIMFGCFCTFHCAAVFQPFGPRSGVVWLNRSLETAKSLQSASDAVDAPQGSTD